MKSLLQSMRLVRPSSSFEKNRKPVIMKKSATLP